MSDATEQFSIQPHPAKSNNPNADPNVGGDRQLGSGVPSGPGIQIPDKDTAQNLEQPRSKEELEKRTAELNK
ncbi:hypothetical protein MPSI1_002780 [Malassezia psittaci]|uniref:Uncharacterized protein n=1 Tax=Malassezia psittaci TaxID=1821823 RepID=A0AAF0JF05_9BASI|nr:hypothetical protein MPSI1_002780 [Malassezia psittaci]